MIAEMHLIRASIGGSSGMAAPAHQPAILRRRGSDWEKAKNALANRFIPS